MKVSIRLYISGDCAATVAPVLRKTNSKPQSPVYHVWNARHPRSRTSQRCPMPLSTSGSLCAVVRVVIVRACVRVRVRLCACDG